MNSSGVSVCMLQANPSMPTKLEGLRERFATPLTQERLFTGMRAYVVVQSRGSAERPQAVTALERLFANVHYGVHAQFLWLGKSLLAMPTPVRLAGHARTQVVVKQRSLGEGCHALTAFELTAVPDGV